MKPATSDMPVPAVGTAGRCVPGLSQQPGARRTDPRHRQRRTPLGAATVLALLAVLPSCAGSAPAASRRGDRLAELRVAPERPRAGYRRDAFPHWIDTDGDSCTTRQEVLVEESVTPAQVKPTGCRVVAGEWISLYDGLRTGDPADIEIDHVVALAEAWDSGASAWDEGRRQAFANDLDHPEALRAVSGATNQAKGDADPAGWRPPRPEAWCEFAHDWVAVKVVWQLSADQPEVDALHRLFDTCPE